jgi:hypothetical protein
VTPVPKSLTPKQVLKWRRLIITGKNPVRATAIAKKS